MTTVIINEKTKKGQIIIDLIKKLSAGKILEDNEAKERVFNKKTVKAIREAEEGKTTKCKNFNDYLEQTK